MESCKGEEVSVIKPENNMSLQEEGPNPLVGGNQILPSEIRKHHPSEIGQRRILPTEYPESSIQNMTHYALMEIEDSMDTINEV